MSQFDPKIQIRATHVTNSFLNVAVPAYALKEPLQFAVGLDMYWAPAAVPGQYRIIVSMQLQGRLADGRQVFLTGASLEQLAQVSGYSDADLADVLEQRLPHILLPYVRAQVANQLAMSSYHTVVVPSQMPDPNMRAKPLPQPQETATEVALGDAP